MPEQSGRDNEEVVPIPPKKSKSGNKVLLTIIGIVVGLIVLSGIAFAVFAWYIADKTNEIVDSAKQYQSQNATKGDDDDRYAQDDVDQIDNYGGRVYATKHGLPSDFPKGVVIVQPSELKQISSRAPAKGEKPVSWHVITQSEFPTVEKTRAAIENEYKGFGEKFDMADLPGGGQSAKDAVMQRYSNDKQTVSIVAKQETEYKRGAVGNFIIVYDVQVK